MAKQKAAKEWIGRTLGDVATVYGVSVPTVKGWRASGMPGQPGRYPLADISRWLRAEGPWRPRIAADGDELLVSGSDSPALERYRQAKAELSELELARQRKDVMPLEDVRRVCETYGSHIKRATRTLRRRYDNGAADVILDALDRAHRELDALDKDHTT